MDNTFIVLVNLTRVCTLHNVGYQNNVHVITCTSYLAILMANNVKVQLYNYPISIQDVHCNIIVSLSNL